MPAAVLLLGWLLKCLVKLEAPAADMRHRTTGSPRGLSTLIAAITSMHETGAFAVGALPETQRCPARNPSQIAARLAFLLCGLVWEPGGTRRRARPSLPCALRETNVVAVQVWFGTRRNLAEPGAEPGSN